jgi:hypothetical protein
MWAVCVCVCVCACVCVCRQAHLDEVLDLGEVVVDPVGVGVLLHRAHVVAFGN